MDMIKTVGCHFIGASTNIIVVKKFTIQQVIPGQLLVEYNIRQIKRLLMNYKKATNNILVDQVLYWDH